MAQSFHQLVEDIIVVIGYDEVEALAFLRVYFRALADLVVEICLFLEIMRLVKEVEPCCCLHIQVVEQEA